MANIMTSKYPRNLLGLVKQLIKLKVNLAQGYVWVSSGKRCLWSESRKKADGPVKCQKISRLLMGVNCEGKCEYVRNDM